MKPLKCHFKNITEADKTNFKTSRCLLTVSVGQESHEDQRLISTLNLIELSFASCIITLHDTLQKYTIAISQGGSADSYYKTALSSGDKWIERNQPYFSSFGNRISIIRWDEWLNDPDFSDKKEKVLAELNHDENYRALFDISINEYLSRYYKRHNNPDALNKKHIEQLCFDYLVEECAVLCLWPKVNCQFEIYSGTHNAAIEETRKRFVHNQYPDLVKSLSPVFNHRPDMKPQNFQISENTSHY